MLKHFWPEIVDEDDAVRVARGHGAAAAAICAFVTGGVAAYALLTGREALPGFGPEVLIDATILAIIAFGIFKMSRIAALCGVGYYLFNLFVMAQSSGTPRFSYITLVLILGYINGVRATFVYHQIRREGREIQSDIPQGPVSVVTGLPLGTAPPQVMVPQPSPVPSKRHSMPSFGFPFKAILLTILVVLGGWAFGVRFHPEAFGNLFVGGSADAHITLTSGQELIGKILEESGDSIKVEVDGGSFTLAKNEVKKIEKGSAKKFVPSSDDLRKGIVTFRREDSIFFQKQRTFSRPQKAAPATQKAISPNSALRGSLMAQAQQYQKKVDEHNRNVEAQVRAMESGY